MKKRLGWVIPIIVVVLMLCVFLVYAETFYHADAVAEAALISDENVRVAQTEFGWFFDGPSEGYALIFYPGGKVEAAAYAPICRELAQIGVDVCLVEMPFRLASFAVNKADGIIDSMAYDHWYIAGHSLGGVIASIYAEEHVDQLDGVIMLAAYAVKPLDDELPTVLVYGTEDGVLNMDKYRENLAYVPAHAIEHVIEGGNHSQFGSYGVQEGDGTALISPERQVEETVGVIAETLAFPPLPGLS